MLKELAFSDLILTEIPSHCKLKGTADGTALSSVPDALHDELARLRTVVVGAYIERDVAPEQSIRVEYDGLFFRCAVYEDIGAGCVYFLRRLPDTVPDFRKLGGLSDKAVDWLLRKEHAGGLVLFSGAQASGKTTSAAAYIAARLALYGGHCVTYEHPVEMPLAGPHGDSGWCYQREIASEADLPAHIERTHRYGSPDIILIGEIRTQYAAAEALRVALGSRRQIVVATIHGQDVISALSRLLTWARSSYGDVACQNLSEVLTAIIHQDIVFTAGEPLLKVPESLLLPYTRRKENSACVKLWQGNLSLEQEIMSNRNDLLFSQGDFRIKQPSDDK